jgi:hypothetical protein
MFNKLKALLCLIPFISCSDKPQKSMIPFEEIEDFYKHMTNTGVNTDTEMLYGYFFTNNSREQLEKVSEKLKADDFQFVDLYTDEEGVFWLHLERIETHNANSLFELNKKLYGIAEEYNLLSYDGFDVGNADKTKGIDRDTYVVPEEFVTNDFFMDGNPYLVVANSAFDTFPHKAEFSFFLNVTSNYDKDNTSQLPNETDYSELDELEAFIENNLNQNNIKNYYLGRTTHAGKRTIFFVGNDTDELKGLLAFLKDQATHRDFEFTVTQDADWKTYKELMELVDRK